MAILSKMRTAALRDFARDESGAVLIEAAFLLPVLFTLFAGAMDLTSIVQARMKVNNLAYNMVTMTSVNGRNVDEVQINDALDNVERIIAPMDDFVENGRAIITAVRGVTGSSATILWNRCVGNGNQDSVYDDAPSSSVMLPKNLDIGPGLTGVVADVKYTFRPKYVGVVFPNAEVVISKQYIHRSRYGEFDTAPKNRYNLSKRSCS